MKRNTIIASLVAVLSATTGANAAEIHIQSQNPVVELAVSEEVKSAPDTAVFNTGVDTSAPTATEALRANSVQVQKLIAKLQALGIASKYVQTSGINLNAEYDYDQANQKQIFKGYRVSNQVSAKVRDISKLGGILDAVVANGATNLTGPLFSINDDSMMLATARERAMARAKELALKYAKGEGYTAVRLLSVQEGASGNSGGPTPYLRSMDVAEKAENVPIAPGQVGSTVTLSLQFEMVK
jgi:uncharacterized protein